jgi:hypothetical protein
MSSRSCGGGDVVVILILRGQFVRFYTNAKRILLESQGNDEKVFGDVWSRGAFCILHSRLDRVQRSCYTG